MKKRILSLVMAIVMVVCLTSCGGEGALAGKWYFHGYEGEGRADYLADVLELLEDGTGIADGHAITWKVENGSFYLTAIQWGTAKVGSWTYNLSDDKLTLTDDNGNAIVYTKEDTGAGDRIYDELPPDDDDLAEPLAEPVIID